MNIFNIKKTFEMKKAKGWPEVYFCIDLHGTIIPSGISSDDKKDKLEFYPYAKEVLQWLSNRKDIIMILWTSTPTHRIKNILSWLNDNNIHFEYLNSNPHAKDTPRSEFSHKFYFNVLMDDRASFSPEDGDWILVARELELATGDTILEWNDKDIAVLSQNIQTTTIELYRGFKQVP